MTLADTFYGLDSYLPLIIIRIGPGCNDREHSDVTTLWIGLGGALGGMARFALGGWVTTWAWAGFPWATFFINVSGSFLLGFLQRALPPVTTSPAFRGFLTIGLCGGFTTFSTFDLETFALLEESRYALAGTYWLGSAATCMIGVAGGMLLADRLRSRSSSPAAV